MRSKKDESETKKVNEKRSTRKRRRGEPVSGGSGGVYGGEDVKGGEENTEEYGGVNCKEEWLRIGNFISPSTSSRHRFFSLTSLHFTCSFDSTNLPFLVLHISTPAHFICLLSPFFDHLLLLRL